MKANEKILDIINKGGTIWDIMYEHYKDQYTREQINEMTFAELSELIDGLK
jgi:PhoPQ-activated pathogenicity-related protein